MNDKTKEAVALIDEARYRYEYDLKESKSFRCYDCESVDHLDSGSGECYLLNIHILNPKKSTCPLQTKLHQVDPVGELR